MAQGGPGGSIGGLWGSYPEDTGSISGQGIISL